MTDNITITLTYQTAMELACFTYSDNFDMLSADMMDAMRELGAVIEDEQERAYEQHQQEDYERSLTPVAVATLSDVEEAVRDACISDGVEYLGVEYDDDPLPPINPATNALTISELIVLFIERIIENLDWHVDANTLEWFDPNMQAAVYANLELLVGLDNDENARLNALLEKVYDQLTD